MLREIGNERQEIAPKICRRQQLYKDQDEQEALPYWKSKKVTAKYAKIRPYVGPILFQK
jgi:hypothetical protein